MKKKILSVMLCFVIFMGIGFTSFAANQYSSDYRLWSQGASNYPRVRQYGCFIVAMSKMIYESGVDTSPSFNPDVFAKWEEDNGFISSLNTGVGQLGGHRAPEEYARQKGKTLVHDKDSNGKGIHYSANKLWDHINAGHYIILNLDNGSHYVFVSNKDSKETGKIMYYESLNGSKELGVTELKRTITKFCVYRFDSSVDCNHQYDSAHKDKCVLCGASFTYSYTNINSTYEVKNNNTPLYSDPYSSGSVLKRLSAGSKIKVIRSFKNSVGNLWYEVDGGYIYSPNLQPAKEDSTLKIDLTRYPEKIDEGSSFGLRGTISSNYNITQVKGSITSGGKTYYSSIDYPNAKSMDVRTANLNNKLLFNKLSIGSYQMVVEAIDASGTVRTATKSFVVAGEARTLELQGGNSNSNSNNNSNSGSSNNKATGATATGVVHIPSGWVNLNIRSGPSQDYDIVGTINDGESCTVYTEQTKNGWYYIKHGNIYGYASGNLITIQDTSGKKTRTGVVNIPSSWNNLNVRSGPGTSYSVVCTMDQGETCIVYVDETKNGWYHINYNGIIGYASSNQIKLQ